MNIPTAPLAAFKIEFEVGVAAGRVQNVRQCGGAQGARPRFVCRTTPVALMTRRKV